MEQKRGARESLVSKPFLFFVDVAVYIYIDEMHFSVANR